MAILPGEVSQSPYIDCRRGQAPDLTTFYLLVVLRYSAAVLFRDRKV